MAEITEKPLVGPKSSDKVMYYYKLLQHEPQANPCHILGTQGATSGTNTATLGSTPAKQVTIKDTGSINQQRVVNVIMTTGDGAKTDVARDLYYAWEHHEEIGLWRVDWNTLRVENGKQVVNAEFAIVKISALPETEALNAAVSSNITFEVEGVARRYDEKGNPFVLGPEDFDSGMFTAITKFYNFNKPTQAGVGSDGSLKLSASDDSTAGVAAGQPQLGASTAVSSSN